MTMPPTPRPAADHTIRTTYQPPSRTGDPLRSAVTADVIVVGAGIVGVTAAVQLAQRGADVVLVTADHVGDGVTGRSTAKVTAVHQLVYAELTDRHGQDAAATYAAASSGAVSWVRDIAGPVWEARAAVTVARDAAEEADLRDEAQAAEAAGLPVILEPSVPGWPGDVLGLRLEGQGQVDPVALLERMLGQVAERIRVFPESRMTGLRERPSGATVVTGAGTATGRHVLLATHMPVVDRNGFFALAEPKASYVVALEHDPGTGADPDMMISAGEPSRSLRWMHDATTGAPVVLIGGEGHHVGTGGPTMPRYERLERWGREHLGAGRRVARWSAMDYMSADRLPLAGPHLRVGGPVQAVTGLSKWGLTLGVASATAIVEHIDGGSVTAFGRLVHPARLPDRQGAATVVKTTATVAQHMVGGWAGALRGGIPPAPAEGDGGVGRAVPTPRGRCRVDGVVHEVSAVCPHLGGIVAFNDGDGTWDCPLHGSRFHADGAVRHGPATRGIGATAAAEAGATTSA